MCASRVVALQPGLPPRRDLRFLRLPFPGGFGLSPFPLLRQSSRLTWAKTLGRLGAARSPGVPVQGPLPRSAVTAGPRAAERCRPWPAPRPAASAHCPSFPSPTRGTAVHVAPGAAGDTGACGAGTPRGQAAVPLVNRIKLLLPLAETPLHLFAPQDNYSAFNCWGAKCCRPRRPAAAPRGAGAGFQSWPRGRRFLPCVRFGMLRSVFMYYRNEIRITKTRLL